MAVEINPIRLNGLWSLGYALDVHVLKSVPIGEDAYGKMHFDNTRSDIGELLYQFKYNHRYGLLDEIVETLLNFLDDHPEMKDVETILPVPPSRYRDYQPTFEIAHELAKRLGKFCRNDILEKTSSLESKALLATEKNKLEGRITKRGRATRKHNILLIDDLYQTGATLNECVRVLKEDPLVDKVFVLTVTKTKN